VGAASAEVVDEATVEEEDIEEEEMPAEGEEVDDSEPAAEVCDRRLGEEGGAVP
jgi:hypothetical protein